MSGPTATSGIERAHLSLNLLQRIVVEAASAHTAEEQIGRLVSQVKEAMQVQVCSLYQISDANLLRMVANIGLAPDVTEHIALPLNEGLVGKIATERLPVNLSRASDHPDYRYFPESGEELFEAFLGAPIVHLGKTMGVIVVQDRFPRAFSADEESFLVTIAAQLAGIMPRLSPPAARHASQRERLIEGVSGAPGQAIGRLHLVVDRDTLGLIDEPRSHGERRELRRLENAVRRAQEEILAARDRLDTVVSGDALAMFDIYAQMLADDRLILAAQEKIQVGASAFSAMRTSIDQHARMFESIDDEYLRARAEDVRHVGHTLLRILLGESRKRLRSADRLVLLGSVISITDIAHFDVGHIVGIVSMKGSKLSHTAVLARALGIPAVVATGPIDHIHEGDRIIVDGDRGHVLLNPARGTTSGYESTIRESQRFDQALAALKDLPATTIDAHRISLLANTGLLADITPGKARGAEGIGLYRSEIPFLTDNVFPTEAEQMSVYRRVLEAYAPLPVTMRTLDLGGDKQLPYLSVEEDNPSLGWRGIRIAMDNPAILSTQLRAMLRADAELGNLRIMFPMVSTVGEMRAVMTLLDRVEQELSAEGTAIRRPPIGIMVEVPGTVHLLPHLRRWIDFISVGTNDLVQYLLAVDRSNPRVASYYDHLHPGVIRTLADISASAGSLDLAASVCGEMATDPYAVVLLLGLGFQTLSLNAYHLPKIKALIRGVSLATCRHCAEEALRCADSTEIQALVHQALIDMGQASLLPSPRTQGPPCPATVI
jgi:phosphoenolpyruvate-protein phosphotransferase